MSNLVPSLNERRPLLHRIKDALLAFRSLPDVINNTIIIAEIGSLLILSDSSIVDFLAKSSKLNMLSSLLMAKEVMLIEILIVISLQLWLNVSLYRLTYLKYFSQFDHRTASTYPIIVLAIVAMMLDFLKSTTSLVYFRSKWAEKYN